MNERASIILAFFLLLFPFHVQGMNNNIVVSPPIEDAFFQSLRNTVADVVVISDNDPFFGLISTSVSCWYDKETDTSGLVPLLVQDDGQLTDAQTRFLDIFFQSSNRSVLVLGTHLDTTYPSVEILGLPPEVCLELATQTFSSAPTVLILPYGLGESYHLSLLAAPLGSYLNMPILLYDQNEAALRMVCTQLHTSNAYVIGNISLVLPNVTQTHLTTEQAITDAILTVIKDLFGSINYLTMANPSDALQPEVISTYNFTLPEHIHIFNNKIILLSREFDFFGNDTKRYPIYVPNGINRLQIRGEVLQKNRSLFERLLHVNPVLFMTLRDEQGRIVAYANSMGYDLGKTYLETLACNASGTYTLEISVYNGLKGGFFVQRGFSRVDADVTLHGSFQILASPHLPMIPGLSCLAPYLTAAHGGLLMANASWELTDESYALAARGSGSGPWYNESLHPFVNAKVNTTIHQLQQTMDLLDSHGLLRGYLDGPAWLAILGDTTMIPMYYYGPSQQDIPDRGLPSDNPYSLSQNLSVGRVISWDVQDVSVLLARTFFYETICGEPIGSDDWHHRFHFVFGEGYSETGGIFHQIPYSREIRTYGFHTAVYGDCRNSRQIAERLGIFSGANYLEYLGHGDWFWFPASLYGLDIYSKAVDVAHAKDWVYEKPSVFLTSACLMGRTDGLPSRMNIGLAMLHAGCNAFVGATRETGQESGLTVLENHLIVDDWSVGEALRGEKRVDGELPTFYVRVVYGDPAFNPFEPAHGFSSQGRPVIHES